MPKRRADWRLGRWTAKRVIRRALPSVAEDAAIEILAAESGAPKASIAGVPAPFVLSISHSHRRSVCAVAAPELRMGCDIEWIEPRSEAFVRDYLTAAEQRRVRAAGTDRWELVTMTWSAKECVLKAMREGLRLDTRDVELTDVGLGDVWRPLRMTHASGSFFGWSRPYEGFVISVASDAPQPEPIQ